MTDVPSNLFLPEGYCMTIGMVTHSMLERVIKLILESVSDVVMKFLIAY
jgi:hypothetical protein